MTERTEQHTFHRLHAKGIDFANCSTPEQLLEVAHVLLNQNPNIGTDMDKLAKKNPNSAIFAFVERGVIMLNSTEPDFLILARISGQTIAMAPRIRCTCAAAEHLVRDSRPRRVNKNWQYVVTAGQENVSDIIQKLYANPEVVQKFTEALRDNKSFHYYSSFMTPEDYLVWSAFGLVTKRNNQSDVIVELPQL